MQQEPLYLLWQRIKDYPWSNMSWMNALWPRRKYFANKKQNGTIYINYTVSDTNIPSILVKCIRSLLHLEYPKGKDIVYNTIIECMCELTELLINNYCIVWSDYLNCATDVLQSTKNTQNISVNFLIMGIRMWLSEQKTVIDIPVSHWMPLDRFFLDGSIILIRTREYITMNAAYQFGALLSNNVIYFRFTCGSYVYIEVLHGLNNDLFTLVSHFTSCMKLIGIQHIILFDQQYANDYSPLHFTQKSKGNWVNSDNTSEEKVANI